MVEKFGELLSYTIDENTVSVNYEKSTAYIKIITKDIINFFVPKISKGRKSKAIEYLDNNICNFTVEKRTGVIDIITEALIIKVYDEFMIDIYTIENELICSDHRGKRSPFIRRSGDYTLLEDEGHEYAKEEEFKVFVKKTMNEDTLFYGLGERTGSLNKRGYHYKNWNTDLPALWTLGYAQSRWSYGNEERLMEIANSFREKDIPCDILYLDIDYMDRYKVFTWNNNRFSNPEEIMKKLKEKGFKVVTIVDPGVKKEKGYSIYDEGLKKGYFATDKDGVVYVNKV